MPRAASRRRRARVQVRVRTGDRRVSRSRRSGWSSASRLLTQPVRARLGNRATNSVKSEWVWNLRGGCRRRRAPTSDARTRPSRRHCRRGRCRCHASSCRRSAQIPRLMASEPNYGGPPPPPRPLPPQVCRAIRGARVRRGAGETWKRGSRRRCCLGCPTHRCYGSGCHRCTSSRHSRRSRLPPCAARCLAGKSCRRWRRRGGSAEGDNLLSGDGIHDAARKVPYPPRNLRSLTVLSSTQPGPRANACCPILEHRKHRCCRLRMRCHCCDCLAHCWFEHLGNRALSRGPMPLGCFQATTCCPSRCFVHRLPRFASYVPAQRSNQMLECVYIYSADDREIPYTNELWSRCVKHLPV